MSTTISYGDNTSTPDIFEGWEQRRRARNRQHDYITGGWDYTLTPAGPRTGTLRLHYLDEVDAVACEQLHATAPYLDLESDARDIVNGRYVVADSGEITLTLTETNHWVVEVAYSEVLP